MRTDVTIPSGGEQLAAWLYRPDGATRDVPCVVMAHGFSATREEGLAPYAERFVAEGLAALVFDYRHFGDSTGEPRQLLDIGRQQADYRAALAFARTLDGIDPQRVALWGSSFSGGHVVAVAAGDPQVAAVVAQAPFTDGIATLMKVPPRNQALALGHAVADLAGSLLGRAPVTVPAVGEPGSFAAMTAPEAKPGFEGIVPAGSRWENRVAARVMLPLGLYRPVAKASQLRMPILVAVCDADETTPPEPAVRLAERAPRGELVRYPIGHFDIYGLEQAREDQAEFLARHLLGVRATAAHA
jgi:fermentation-respiration switch protein FrsA (DUF1100 family)